MKIRDLPDPVTALKTDWRAGDTWIGFTPTGTGPAAAAQCQSTINRQMRGGYIVEYIAKVFQLPNPGFEKDPAYLAEVEAHRPKAGKLVAVHRLKPSSRPLIEIVGEAEFKRTQDMWAQNNVRNRWSVAFPIIESFRVIGGPLARDVFSASVYNSVIQRSSATLRPLDEQAQQMLADLDIAESPAFNAWIAIADDFEKAERTEVSPRVLRLIGHDLEAAAMEGDTVERRQKLTRRAAWLAEKFARERLRSGLLRCDHCRFDPTEIEGFVSKAPRSLLDVHHLRPLDEGRRVTSVKDFVLLCPTCHRIEHQRLKQLKT